MGARLIAKCRYVRNIDHVINELNYAGNKIDHQIAIFNDGSLKEQNGCEMLKLSSDEKNNVSSVKLFFKDGGHKEISYDSYCKMVTSTKEKITVSKIEDIDSDILPKDIEDEEINLKNSTIEDYLFYVANREGVEKEDGHGLFGINGNIPIEEATDMVTSHSDSIFWKTIISIRGEDGEKTGYNNRKAWQELVVSKAPQIAKAYNISLDNLVINCGFHSNTDNYHIHLTFYSTDKNEGFVNGGKKAMQKASENIKSLFANEIFKDEVSELKNLANLNKSNLKQSLLVSLSKIDIEDENLISMFQHLANGIENHKGRKDYGYLSPELKNEVNNLLSYMIKNTDELSELFENLCNVQKDYIEIYNQDEAKTNKRLEDFKSGIFNPKKGRADLQNIIVHYLKEYNKEKAHLFQSKNCPATKEKKDDYMPHPHLLSNQINKAVWNTAKEEFIDIVKNKSFCETNPQFVAKIKELQSIPKTDDSFFCLSEDFFNSMCLDKIVTQEIENHLKSNNYDDKSYFNVSSVNKILSENSDKNLKTKVAKNYVDKLYKSLVVAPAVKEVGKDIKNQLKTCLDECITSDCFSSQYIKEQLLSSNNNSTKEILRAIYQDDFLKNYIDTFLYNVQKEINLKHHNLSDEFVLFINDAPCEYENVFKYSRLYGYINTYKENYVENGYKAILNAMDEDIKSDMSAEISNKLNIMISSPKDNIKKKKSKEPIINKEDTSKLLIELYKLPKPSEDCTEKELEEYILKKQKLISNIFNKHIVMDVDEKGNKTENKQISAYIETAKDLFNQHAGDSNAALTMENVFETDIYSGDFYVKPNSQISFFAENLPSHYIRNILSEEQSKRLLRPIYGTLKKEIYATLLDNGNEGLKKINSISEELKNTDSSEEKNALLSKANDEIGKIISDCCNNQSLKLSIDELKKHIIKQINQLAPKEIKQDILKQLDISFEKDVLNLPYGYMVFSMGQEYETTVAEAVADNLSDSIKKVQSMIYKDIYKVLGQRSAKRENNPIYKAICSYNQNVASELGKVPGDLKQSDIDIMSIFAALMEKNEYRELFSDINTKFNNQLCSLLSCDNEKAEELFQKVVLENEYGGIYSSVRFMCENSNSIIEKINRQKAVSCLFFIANLLGQGLSDQSQSQQQENDTHRKNKKLTHKNKFQIKPQQNNNNNLNNYLGY